MSETPPTLPRDAVWVVVPAGGAGTRLWPLSRAHTPKFLLPLTGPRSLLQATLDRLAPIASPDRSLIVCGAHHIAAVAGQLPEIPASNLVGEPVPRGSGSAIGLAAAIIARRQPGAIMASFAADHDIRNQDEFVRAVRVAIDTARNGYLVTIGLKPTEPATGFGYIERTDEVACTSQHGHAYRANRFVEKPDRATAGAFIATGRYSWNASMFIWSVDRLLEEMSVHLPELHAGLCEIAAAWDTDQQDDVFTRVWPTLPDVTIDNGIMEKADRIAVVPADLAWSDVGDWHGLGRLLDVDESANSGVGDRITNASGGNVIWATEGKLVALLGVDDLIVVDTPDALLVARRDCAQEVKRIVSVLNEQGRKQLL